MKRKEIFISYKRVDKDVVFKFRDRIENEVKKDSCWIDFNGIESDAQFAEVIMKAIDEADVILFMYSASHTQIKNYSTDWTVRELNYAQENAKRIVFVNIDKTPLNKWFTMMFPLKQLVDGTSTEAVDKLIRDIKMWLKEANEEKSRSPQFNQDNSYVSQVVDDDYETAEILYKEKEYGDAIPLYLSSAEHGNVNAQNRLCQFFYDEIVPMDSFSEDFWEQIEEIASRDEDYANFIMHCRYYNDTKDEHLSFSYVRKATKNGKVPLAFLRLGISYGWGLGTKQNEILANHNYQKAIGLGCKEACSYIGQVYEFGSMKIEKDFSKALEYYKRGTELLDRRSMRFLVNSYHYNLNQTDKAKEVAQKMIDVGYENGYVLMGNLFSFDSEGNWSDTDEGKKWYREALLHDAYEAYAELAYIYWIVEDNHEEAYALAKQGCMKHDSTSMKTLGVFYEADEEYEKAWACYTDWFNKVGTTSGMLGSLFFEHNYRKDDKDDEKRLEDELESILKVEAYRGNEDSLKYLLRLLVLQDTGEDSMDYAKLKAVTRTYEYIKQGAELGQPDMMFIWGKMILDDDLQEFNPIKGLNLILKSALEGNKEALTYLFDYYQTGRYKDNVDYDRLAVAAIKNKFIEKDYIGGLLRYGESHTDIDEDFIKFLSDILDKGENFISKKHYIQVLNAFFIKCYDGSVEIEPKTIDKFKLLVDRERMNENYACLSKMRKVINKVYPDYNKEKAISDILEGHNSVDADIYYAICTTDNENEIDIKLQDSLLYQLYSPILQNNELMQHIIEYRGIGLYGAEEGELPECISNLKFSYASICKDFEIAPCDLVPFNEMDIIPYVSPGLLMTLRKQALKCLLSIKDVEPLIKDEFLNNLNSDEELLNICEKISNQDIQLFLISFVELNLDIEAVELSYYGLLENFEGNKQVLAGSLNSFVKRLTDVGIEHHLPEYNINNLPNVDLGLSFQKTHIDIPDGQKEMLNSFQFKKQRNDDDFEKLLDSFIKDNLDE